MISRSNIKSSRQNRRRWIQGYRTFQLLMTEFNDVMGKIFLPVQMAGMISICVVGNYALVRLEELHFIGVASVLVFDLTCGALLSIWNRGARFQQLSVKIVQRGRAASRDHFSRRLVRSCPIISVQIGSFYPLSRRVIQDIISGVGLSCLSLLLATGA